MDALRIENLSKEYSSFKLDNVSFSVPKGSIVGFIGENGAGKTTTMKTMLNLVKKDGEAYRFLGKNMTRAIRK